MSASTHDSTNHVLGDLSIETFLRDYWQKKPVLIRGAFPDFETPISPEELAGLACEADAPSRLILEHGDERDWQLKMGPFTEYDFRALPDDGYSLLVTDCEKLVPELMEIVERFRDFGALAVASHNVADYQLADRVELIQSDGFDQLLDADDKPLVFDLIVSNPPYVDPDEAEDLPDEYHHEPAGALFAPDQGLALVERLLDQAADHLSPGGWIFIEMGNGRHWFDQRWPGHHGLWVDLSPAPSSIVAFKREQLGQWRGEETT